jgi:hypothetical protein
MAIEVTPSSNLKMPLWAVIIFVVDIILIAIFLSLYFYFSWQEKNLEQALIKTPQEESLEQEVVKKQDELVVYTNRIEAFAKIIADHKKVSNVFGLIEKICLPSVWFSNFNFTLGKNEVSLSGKTDNFVSLGNQITILKNELSFLSINLSNLMLEGKGGVSFSLQAVIDPKILTSQGGSLSQ